MKRIGIFLSAVALMVVTATTSFAGTGVFGSYIAIDTDPATPATYTWYGISQPGPNTTTAFNGFNIGTFYVGQQATIAGGELLTYKNGGGNVTGAQLQWRVDSGTWNTISISWTADATFNDALANTFSNSGDQKWANLASQPDFMSSQAAGSHTLSVWFRAFTNEGDRDYGSQASPYTANFTLNDPPAAIPEPSTVLLWLVGLGMMYAKRNKIRSAIRI